MEEKELPQCLTDNRGHKRNVLCRFPFTIKGDNGIEYNECQMDVNKFPTTNNRKCKQFIKENPDFDWKSVAFVQIWYNKNKLKTHCYSKHLVEEHGWCGVCEDDAKPGQPGFCNHTSFTEEGNAFLDNDEVLTIGNNARSWGYCSPECADILGRDPDYGEDLLDVKTLKE